MATRGAGASGFGVGDHVFAYTGVVKMGAWAEYVVEETVLARAPRSVSLVKAAAPPFPVRLALAVMSTKLRRKAKKLGVTYRFLFIEPDSVALRSIAALVGQGVLRPAIGRVLPFD